MWCELFCVSSPVSCWLVTTQAESVGKGKVTGFWSYDTKKMCVFVCVCVFGRGRQVELTVVLFLLICCVTQMGVYLSHELCFCSRKHMKIEPIIEDSLLRYYKEISWFSDMLSHCIFMTGGRFSRPIRVKHKYHRRKEHHQHSFWRNVAWMCELFWFFEEHVVQFIFLKSVSNKHVYNSKSKL